MGEACCTSVPGTKGKGWGGGAVWCKPLSSNLGHVGEGARGAQRTEDGVREARGNKGRINFLGC